MDARSILLTHGGAPSKEAIASARAADGGLRARAGRCWAIVMALFAVLSIVTSAPAHALEGVRVAPLASPAVSQAAVLKAQESALVGKVNIHALPGHSCATHCAGHTLATLDTPASTVPGAHGLVRWSLSAPSPPDSSHSLGLKRPPRA